MASRRQHGRPKEERAILLDRLMRARGAGLLRRAEFHSQEVDDAEDALADACVKFMRYFDGEHDDDAMQWMLLVVKHCAWAIDGRRRGRRALVEEISAESELGTGLPDLRRGPAQLLLAQEEVARFSAAIDALKSDQRRAVMLFGLGCSYAEIGRICGWTATKVNRSLAEGRARLRELLAKGGESL